MLDVILLGETAIRLHGKPISRFRSQTEIALVAYLAHSGQAHSREALADLLWDASTTGQSFSNLRTALTRLRKQVGDHLIVTRKTIAVTPTIHQKTDSARFQALLSGAGKERSAAGIHQLTQGLDLYAGEFMAGFFLPNAPRFNDWLVIEQERIRQLALRGYRQLAGWQEEQGDFAAGVITIQRWLSCDPLDETAQEQLMRLLAYDGRIAEALGVYEKYRDLLQTELAILPAPDIAALYQSIQDGSLPTPEISPTPLHNLPRALTPLFGRKNEIEKLTNTLLNPGYPLVSITGVGGMGKTSLALATGRQLTVRQPRPFKDGIWFISLEGIENDALEKVREEVAALVGQAMGLFFHGESDLWTQMLGQLASKNLLLILDNIEQFLTVASDLVLGLLEAGDGIHVLTTSRTTVPLAASFAFPLTGLETPTQVSAEALQNESVRLFAERAGRLPTSFYLEEHLSEVVSICQFVEGMPLGIELAAASLGKLMVDEIMPALTSNLHLLNSTRRDLPPRQRTFHAVFDYTWQLLDPREQALLAQTSIFRDGFTRQAADALLNDSSYSLYSLQHHALLSRDETGRFRMHPLLRQLAREKLNDPSRSDLAEQAQNRHAFYFTSLAQSFEKDLQYDEGRIAMQTLLLEQANLRAAWQHALQAGQWQLISNCLDSTHYFYQRKGFFNEEATLVDSAITAVQATLEENDISLTSLLSRLLTARAWSYLNLSQFENGIRTAERACQLAQSVENASIEAQARLAWAQILSTQHKHELAMAQFEQAVPLAKKAQNQILEADGWIGIGSQILWQADVNLAQEPLFHALELCRTLQYKPGEVEALILLGDLALRREDFALSVTYDEQALQLSRLLGDAAVEAEVLGSLGVGLTAVGDLVGSQTYHKEALDKFRQLTMPEKEQWLLGQLGYTTIKLGDYATAEQNLKDALTIARRIKDEFWQAWIKLRLGDVWHGLGKSEQALSIITEVYQTAEQLQNPRFLAAVLYQWGNVLLSQADWTQAEQKFQQAYDLWQRQGQTQNALLALAGLAYAAYQQEMLTTAAAHAEQIWQILQESPVLAERADLSLYWRLGMVWQGMGDSRADSLWKKARALLQQRSEKIEDTGARRMFLQNVPAHRAILNSS
jgi:DNA-binding SARP family transcriptional activator/predicted ATPase/Tfp pilus assembly protein PilF